MAYPAHAFSALFYDAYKALQPEAPKNPLVLRVAALATAYVKAHPELKEQLEADYLRTSDALNLDLASEVDALYGQIIRGEINEESTRHIKVDGPSNHADKTCYEKIFRMLAHRFATASNEEEALILLKHFPQKLKTKLLKYLTPSIDKHLCIKYFKAFTIETPEKRYVFAKKLLTTDPKNWEFLENFELSETMRIKLFLATFHGSFLNHPKIYDIISQLNLKSPALYLELAILPLQCDRLVAIMDAIGIVRTPAFNQKFGETFIKNNPQQFLNRAHLIPFEDELLLSLRIQAVKKLGFEKALLAYNYVGEEGLKFTEEVILDNLRADIGNVLNSYNPFYCDGFATFATVDGFMAKIGQCGLDAGLEYIKSTSLDARQQREALFCLIQFATFCETFPDDKWTEMKTYLTAVPIELLKDIEWFHDIEDLEVRQRAYNLTATLHRTAKDAYSIPQFVRRTLISEFAHNKEVIYLRYMGNLLQKQYYSSREGFELHLISKLLCFCNDFNGATFTVDKLLKSLQADCKHVPIEAWEQLFAWARLEGHGVNLRALLLGTPLLETTKRIEYPKWCFSHLIPTLARQRNSRILSQTNLLLRRQNPSVFKYLGRLCQKHKEGLPLTPLLTPMMMLGFISFDASYREVLKGIKELLLPLKDVLKNRDTGLAQALNLTALYLLKKGKEETAYLKKIRQALLLKDPTKIKRALYSLIFLKRMDTLADLNEEWTLVDLEKSINDTWGTKFGIDTTLIDDFQTKFQEAFGDYRMQGNFELYAGAHEGDVRSSLKTLVLSVLDGSFNAARFEPSSSAHLTELAKFPEIYAKWQEIDPPQPLDLESERAEVTEETVRAMFDNAVLHGHMGPLTIPTSEVACTDDVDRCIFALLNGPPTLAKAIALKEALELVPSPPELLNDIKYLITQMEPQAVLEDLTIECTYNYRDSFLSGTEVPGSCQRVDGLSKYNKALLAFVLDGKNQMIAIKNKEGKLVSRVILRLLLDKRGRPVLFVERLYGKDTPGIRAAIHKKAIERAKQLGVPLFIRQNGCTSLHSLGSSAPFEYADSATEPLNNGEFTVENARRVPITPLDFDLSTIEKSLNSIEPIAYTEVLHKAAFCLNEKLSSDAWGTACRAYIAETGDAFSYNGDEATGTITNPKRLLELLDV